MPRRPRIAVAGVPLHIIQRGNNRQACFFSADDHRLYLELLAQYAQDSGCAIHAYVLMTNHVHLLLTPADADSASIVNLSSTAGLVGSATSPVYSMTKGGVRLFTKSTAIECSVLN